MMDQMNVKTWGLLFLTKQFLATIHDNFDTLIVWINILLCCAIIKSCVDVPVRIHYTLYIMHYTLYIIHITLYIIQLYYNKNDIINDFNFLKYKVVSLVLKWTSMRRNDFINYFSWHFGEQSGSPHDEKSKYLHVVVIVLIKLLTK